jgi:K+-transporting ATPase ATPase C chain
VSVRADNFSGEDDTTMTKGITASTVAHARGAATVQAPVGIDLRQPVPYDAAPAEDLVESWSFLDHLYTAATFAGLFIAVCCGVYPVLIWGIAQAIFPVQANGSLVTRAGEFTTIPEDAVGSALLAQNFAAPQYFHPRPSAAGTGYDASSSSGTNLGPLSDKLINGVHDAKNADGTPNPAGNFDGIKDLVAAYRTENGLAADAIVPADAVTRSGSGLDPHISPANAAMQAARVAQARGLTVETVRRLIAAHTDSPGLGVLGEPGVNVLLLNLALDQGRR